MHDFVRMVLVLMLHQPTISFLPCCRQGLAGYTFSTDAAHPKKMMKFMCQAGSRRFRLPGSPWAGFGYFVIDPDHMIKRLRNQFFADGRVTQMGKKKKEYAARSHLRKALQHKLKQGPYYNLLPRLSSSVVNVSGSSLMSVCLCRFVARNHLLFMSCFRCAWPSTPLTRPPRRVCCS